MAWNENIKIQRGYLFHIPDVCDMVELYFPYLPIIKDRYISSCLVDVKL